jgi:hypothetical protein
MDSAAGVYLYEVPPSRFFLGGLAILYVLYLVRKRVLNSCRIWSPTGLNTPHPFPATYSLYILYFDWGEGRVEPQREG